MMLWEIIILMIVATICISGGIAFVYDSIVNTIEKYQIRRTERDAKLYATIIQTINEAVKPIIDKLKDKKKEFEKEMDE